MFRSPLLAALALGAFSVAGCATDAGLSAGADASAAMPADMTPEARDAYVTMAAASDLFEIQSATLARTRAQRPEVRAFADMLIQHHTQTSAQLMAAARTAGAATPMPRLMPMQARMMEELRAASGAGFDQVFIRQQIPAHEMALALHSNYAQNGDTAALRVAAQAATPIVQQHLDRARQLD